MRRLSISGKVSECPIQSVILVWPLRISLSIFHGIKMVVVVTGEGVMIEKWKLECGRDSMTRLLYRCTCADLFVSLTLERLYGLALKRTLNVSSYVAVAL